MSIIYRIFNVVTEHFYIGSTLNPRRRKWEHWNDLKLGVHHCAALQAAWTMYGPDAFDFEVLEEVADPNTLRHIEDTYLLNHAGKEYCYNSSFSALNGGFVSPDVGAKISATLRQLYSKKEAHPRYGKTHSDETKAKISRARKGKMAGQEHYRYGKTLSPEVREKIGNTQRGVRKKPRVYTPEGLARAQENMRCVAAEHPQEAKAWEEVLAKFPEDVCQRYDFSKAVYTGALARITGVVCPSHGGFSNYSAQFRKGRGCPQCGAGQRAESKRKQMKEVWATPEGRKAMLDARKKLVDTPDSEA